MTFWKILAFDAQFTAKCRVLRTVWLIFVWFFVIHCAMRFFVPEETRIVAAFFTAIGALLLVRLIWGMVLYRRPWVRRALAVAPWDTVVVADRQIIWQRQGELVGQQETRLMLDGERRLIACFLAAAAGEAVALWPERPRDATEYSWRTGTGEGWTFRVTKQSSHIKANRQKTW